MDICMFQLDSHVKTCIIIIIINDFYGSIWIMLSVVFVW